MSSLDLAVVGNCSIAALVDRQARIVWGCFPRLDDDPVFCALVDDDGKARDKRRAGGDFSIEIEGFHHSTSSYIENTAVLVTVLTDERGNSIQVTDLAPRFTDNERMFRPPMLLRRIAPLSGRARVRVRLRPRFDYGATEPDRTRGSNHARYVSGHQALRLTTNAPLSYILEESAFVVDRPLEFFFGSDERMQSDISRTGREFFERTVDFWQTWVRSLSIPIDWQDAVIRAAITLKLCNFEETGAIVAALTTSIPEAAGTQRNWDYRYCWLRDAYFVIHALNGLGATRTMEDYINYISNIVDDAKRDRLNPVYGISRTSILEESNAASLAGFRRTKPVRVGNAAYQQVQNDVYGSVVLALTHAFFDKRLLSRGNDALLDCLEELGKSAIATFGQPDAGPWELRLTSKVHTFSCLMSWAACDRLAKISAVVGRQEREKFWRANAERMHRQICEQAWNTRLNSFVSTFGGHDLDATLLLLGELGFLAKSDSRYLSTVSAIEKHLMHDGLLYRYATQDDFGFPETAFVICSFWYVSALADTGRKDEARRLFERLMERRNSFGLLSEDIDTRTGELWGNFPQTYSMVGLINSVVKLSRKWEDVF